MDDLIQLQSRASDLAEEHRHTESHPMFVEALDGLEALMGPTHTMTILALNSFVTSCISQGCFHDAESRLQKSMKDHHSELGNANPKTYQSIARLGSYYKRQKRYGESEKLIRHAIKGLESVYSFDLEAQFNSTNNSVVELIKIYCMNYDFENAENECLQLIAKSEALKGPYQRRCLEFKHYLSHIYEHYVWHSLVYRNNNFLKDPPLHKFEQLLLELIDDSEERSASIAITACSFELLLWQYFKQNQVDKLESLLDRAGSKVKSVPGLSSIMDLPTMEDVRALKTDIPTPFSEVGKHGEAERWFTHLQRQIEDAFGEGYRRYFQTLMLQALDDLKQGLWEQAEPLLLGAQVIRRRCRTRRSPCYLTRWSRCVSTKGSLVLEHPTLSDPTEEH